MRRHVYNALLALAGGIMAAIVAYKAFMFVQKVIMVIRLAVLVFKLWRAGLLATAIAQWRLNAAMIANPIGLIIAAIAGLVVGLVILYRKSNTVRNAINAMWRAVKVAASFIATVAVAAFQRLWSVLRHHPVAIIIRNFGRIISYVRSMPEKISSAASGMWDGIKNGFRSALNWIIDKWNALELPSMKVAGKTIFPGLKTPDIQRFADGGTVGRSGLSLVGERGPELRHLNKGDQITPNHELFGGDTYVFLDSEPIAARIEKNIKRKAMRR